MVAVCGGMSKAATVRALGVSRYALHPWVTVYEHGVGAALAKWPKGPPTGRSKKPSAGQEKGECVGGREVPTRVGHRLRGRLREVDDGTPVPEHTTAVR